MKRTFLVLGLFFGPVATGSSQEFVGPHGYLTLEAEISDRDSVSRRGTFDLHHFNLIGSFLLDSRSRVFAEIEWEHGTDTEIEEESQSEAGIVRIERAWFEYKFSTRLKLRLGKFLTPYGIYNLVHDAAPTFDTSILPMSIYGKHLNAFGRKQRFYAKFAIGVQVLGTVEFGNSNIQYQATLSNGRGDEAFEQDDNGNKGLGLRLLADLPTSGLKIGYSLYTDRNGRSNDARQTANAWDVRWQYRRLKVSGEFAHADLGTGGLPVRSQVSNAGYGEIAYDIFGRQTILVRYDIFDPDTHLSNNLEKDLTIGTSIKVRPNVVAKAELHFWNVQSGPNRNFVLAISSLAVVF